MPKRTDIQSILIIGAGPIVIGQACEFDYSGTQACKALREEGYRVVLVNSNPATIMTDVELADATYVEPVTADFLEKIIARERPDALLPTMGGQTALNSAMALAQRGVFGRYGVTLIGARREAIEMAENRQAFRDAMVRIGLETPRAAVAGTIEEARDARAHVGLPAVIRPAYTLGGAGGGIAYDREEYDAVCRAGLSCSPIGQILIDECLAGWKEFEMEVVRDCADNAIIVCSIENVDPMGVHTGDSITVAPALTLTDKEYQIMRDASIAVLREIGVETGGANVQFAVNPADGRMVVIEMNPRVSRSSALASKATGFPIAKIAAKLAVGYTLDELDNDMTRVTPASFEPSIDYIVTKIPRFAFEKFPDCAPELMTSMRSVGEVMAIGRNFRESLQKALRALEMGFDGLDAIAIEGLEDETDQAGRRDALRAALLRKTPDRIRVVAQAFREGMTAAQIADATSWDPWFLREIEAIISAEALLLHEGVPRDEAAMRALKSQGFSDRRIARLCACPPQAIAALRARMGVHPLYKRVDSCAAEHEAATPYMYGTWERAAVGAGECEANPTGRDKVIILGGGPNRIGQGIEFDYCCCQACFALREMGLETIMINCNPETVSTDYDTSDRLYFEPLTEEDVFEILRVEMRKGRLRGVMLQFGGQTPLKLAKALARAKIPILGTSHDSIDLAEDRERFQALTERLGLKTPENGLARSREDALQVAHAIGFPLLVRPSYVLGGRAMEIVRDAEGLTRIIGEAMRISGRNPVLIDRYLAPATEVDVDALSDGREVHVAGVMEHIEEAGVHSGDSACSLPPHSLSAEIVAAIKAQTRTLARALKVVGLMNVQFAVKDGEIFVLEVNPRASRTVPFVAKATGLPIAKIAAQLMAGRPLSAFDLPASGLPAPEPGSNGAFVSVKEAVLPFNRFPGVDTVLGPEMRSTGEVMGRDRDFARAFLKSQIAAGVTLPESGLLFVSVREADKEAISASVRRLKEAGFHILATRGTAAYLQARGIEAERVNKVHEGERHIVHRLRDGDVSLIFNTTEGLRSLHDSKGIRAMALVQGIPYYTTIAGADAAVRAILAAREGGLCVNALQRDGRVSQAESVRARPGR